MNSFSPQVSSPIVSDLPLPTLVVNMSWLVTENYAARGELCTEPVLESNGWDKMQRARQLLLTLKRPLGTSRQDVVIESQYHSGFSPGKLQCVDRAEYRGCYNALVHSSDSAYEQVWCIWFALFLTRVVGLSSGTTLKDMGLRTTLRLAQPRTLRWMSTVTKRL